MSSSTSYTTITDQKNVSIDIVDTVRYNKLSSSEQSSFCFLRNSILELIGLTSSSDKFDVSARQYAENYAFINIQGIEALVDDKIDAKIKTLKSEIESEIATAVASLSTASTSKTST